MTKAQLINSLKELQSAKRHLTNLEKEIAKGLTWREICAAGMEMQAIIRHREENPDGNLIAARDEVREWAKEHM